MKDFKTYMMEGPEAELIGLLKSFGAGDIDIQEDHLTVMLRKKQQVWEIIARLPMGTDYDVFVYEIEENGERKLENPGGIDNSGEDFVHSAETEKQTYTIGEIGYEDLTDSFHEYQLIVYLFNAEVSDGPAEGEQGAEPRTEEIEINEATDIKFIGTQLMKRFGSDPYYKDLIMAMLKRDKKGADASRKALVSVRGPQALKNLISSYKEFEHDSLGVRKESTEGNESLSPEEITERKRLIKVNARGERRIKIKCKKGYKFVTGKCVKISGKEATTKRRSIRRAVRTKKNKGAGFVRRTQRLTKRAKRKRKNMGLKTGFVPTGDMISEARESNVAKKVEWMRVYEQGVTAREDVKGLAEQIDWDMATHYFFTGAEAETAAQTVSSPFKG